MKIVKKNKKGQVIEVCRNPIYGTHYKIIGSEVRILQSPFKKALEPGETIEVEQ
jgi:hypothetical protein